jgi:hypothetical protein
VIELPGDRIGPEADVPAQVLPQRHLELGMQSRANWLTAPSPTLQPLRDALKNLPFSRSVEPANGNPPSSAPISFDTVEPRLNDG